MPPFIRLRRKRQNLSDRYVRRFWPSFSTTGLHPVLGSLPIDHEVGGHRTAPSGIIPVELITYVRLRRVPGGATAAALGRWAKAIARAFSEDKGDRLLLLPIEVVVRDRVNHSRGLKFDVCAKRDDTGRSFQMMLGRPRHVVHP